MQFKIYRIWLGGFLALGLSVVNVNLRAADKPINVRLGTLAPRGTSYHKSLLAMGEKWRQATGGAVRLTIFPDGIQGSEADMVGLMQTGNLLEHLTVVENIRAAKALAPGTRGPAPGDLLAQVGIAERANAAPSTLSGGEAARAGLAVALANDPPVLLADEPTGDVDASNEEVLLSLLQKRAKGDRAVVVVTHSERVASAADRVIHLLDGRVVDG